MSLDDNYTEKNDGAVELPGFETGGNADEVAELRRQLAELQRTDVASDATPQEREALAGYATGILDDRKIEVPPVNLWKSSGMRALNQGDFETWAERVLSDKDYDAWCEVDPNLDQINEFFESIGDQLGTDRGNSRASRRSSNRTRRR